MNTAPPPTHILKCDPDSFDAVWSRAKLHEIRFNDRNYSVGDVVSLNETKWSAATMAYKPDAYPLLFTGRCIVATITHIQDGYGLARDWVVLSLRITSITKGPKPPIVGDLGRGKVFLK